MQSPTSGVSQLSISEPSTTSAPAQIPKEYDLSDSEHEALDGDVLKNFSCKSNLVENPIGPLFWVILSKTMTDWNGCPWRKRKNCSDAIAFSCQYYRRGGLAVHLQRFVDYICCTFLFPIIIVDVVTNLSDMVWNHEKSALPAGHKSTPHEGKVTGNYIVVLWIADGFIYEQYEVWKDPF